MLIALLGFCISASILEQAHDIFLDKTEIENSKKSAEKTGEKLEKELENEAEKDHFLTFDLSKKANQSNFRNAQNAFQKGDIEYLEIVSPPPEHKI